MFRKIARSDEIKEDSTIVFSLDKTDILIGRRNGVLYAFNNSCPHRGASLSKGEIKGANIICYMHGYEYNIFTGKLENMKSWKKEKQWTEQRPEWRESNDLTLYPILEKDGYVYLNFPNNSETVKN